MPDKETRKIEEQDSVESYVPPIQFKPENLGLARNEGADQHPAGDAPPNGPVELRGVYIISVAARILEMHPQTLRKYERLGFITPYRTLGMLRLYSQEDIEKLRLIRHLEEKLGLNLAGVEFTLELLNHLLEMLQKLAVLEEAQQFVHIVEQAMADLFRRLNLPLREDSS